MTTRFVPTYTPLKQPAFGYRSAVGFQKPLAFNESFFEEQTEFNLRTKIALLLAQIFCFRPLCKVFIEIAHCERV